MDDLQLIHMADLRRANDTLEAAMEAVRGVRKARTRVRTLCRTDGFPLALIDEILADELLPLHEVEEREAKRLRMRGVAQQPGGSTEQQDLFNDSFAAKERQEVYWRDHGKTVGLRGGDPDITKYDVPPEHIQAWEEERREGTARLEKAYLTKNRIEGVTAAAHPGGPGLSAADLAKIGDANDNDATPPPAADANDAGESVPPTGGENGSPLEGSPSGSDGDDADAEGLEGASAAQDKLDAEGFEASDEELAAQKTRQGIQEGRVGEAQPPATESSGDGASASELNAGSDTTPASPASSGTSSEEPEKPSIDEPCPLCGAEAGEACHEDCPGEEPAAA